MVRPVVALLATALLAACTPLASSPGASPSATSAPTPRGAAGSVGPTVQPVDASCRFSPTGGNIPSGVFIAVADSGGSGTAFVLDAATGVERGRLQIAGAPEGAVDWVGKRLLLFCSVAGAERLVAYDLSSLREQWRIPVDARSITKAPGGLPALAVGSDGRFVFVLHYRTLRAGDAYAPGASLTWLTAHDARTGVEQGRVEFPDCVAARIFVASDGTTYVFCGEQLLAIDTTTWSVSRILPFASSNSVGPIGILSNRAIYGVTRELQVLVMDLATGQTTRMGKSDTAARAQAWGHLTMTPSGLTLWVIAKASGDRAEYDPDTLAVLSLSTWSLSETHVPGLRGVGLVGTRVVYGVGGTLRSTDGVIDKALVDGRVDYWHIFGPPNSSN